MYGLYGSRRGKEVKYREKGASNIELVGPGSYDLNLLQISQQPDRNAMSLYMEHIVDTSWTFLWRISVDQPG